MPKILRLLKAPPPHKWIAVFQDGTRTSFGAQGYDDYTITKDDTRKRLYRERHAKDLDTGDPKRAGFLSYYILWNHKTIKESIKDYNRRFSRS